MRWYALMVLIWNKMRRIALNCVELYVVAFSRWFNASLIVSLWRNFPMTGLTNYDIPGAFIPAFPMAQFEFQGKG